MAQITQDELLLIEEADGTLRPVTLDDVQGPPGPPGSSEGVRITRTAGEVLAGHRVVTTDEMGHLVYCSLERAAVGPLWLTVGAALAGEPVEVVPLGEVTEPSWAWVPETPVYLAEGGVLSSAPSGDTVSVIVGTALTPTTIFFNPSTPVRMVA